MIWAFVLQSHDILPSLSSLRNLTTVAFRCQKRKKEGQSLHYTNVVLIFRLSLYFEVYESLHNNVSLTKTDKIPVARSLQVCRILAELCAVASRRVHETSSWIILQSSLWLSFSPMQRPFTRPMYHLIINWAVFCRFTWCIGFVLGCCTVEKFTFCEF